MWGEVEANTPGGSRLMGSVGLAGDGARCTWGAAGLGDDIRSVGNGEGLCTCVTTLNLRGFGSGPRVYEDHHTLFRNLKGMGADLAGFADVGTSSSSGRAAKSGSF